jgi:prepilin-type processing-associated H-X9-DG protein
MTNWLKWRLCALMGTAAFVGGALVLHAQNDYPAPAKSPEEAGALFGRMLANISTNEMPSRGGPNDLSPDRFLGVISRAQAQDRLFGSRGRNLDALLSTLARERDEPNFDAQVVSRSADQTIVSVSPATPGKGREIVVVPEDGGFRVDLFATYGRWNNLSGASLDKAIYGFTGIVTPTLAKDTRFLENVRRSDCQTRLKQQMLGVLQYAQDYDEKLPPARRWVDVLQPYVKSEQVFQCPALNGRGNGYAYNSNLSQIPLSRMHNMAALIGIYETSNLSRNVFGPFTGKAYRHSGGQNLAFADGHIKWFQAGTELSRGNTIKP